MTKYRFHSLDYTKDELTWMGKHNIIYTFLADSNFAMHPRDKEIAEHAVKVKKEFGAPSKLRVCWGKNTDEKVFQVASILHEAELEKGITLARQSNDEETLKNIRRDNIKLSTYQNLQRRFMDKNVPTYTELILGLPGETITSWKKGVDEILTSSQLKATLFVYMCQVLPNTELWRPEYREKHGIKTRMVELTEIHGSQRSSEWIKEFEELVIATNTMPYRDWRYLCKFSWMTMLLHSMKTGFFVLSWLWDRWKIPPSQFISDVANHCLIGKCNGTILGELNKWDELLNTISVFGESRGQILAGYGDIYWDAEEAALLRMAEQWQKFYEDLEKFVRTTLNENDEKTGGAEYNRHEMYEVIAYQKDRMPSLEPAIRVGNSRRFDYNVPEYFDKLFGTSPVPLERKPQIATYSPKEWNGDSEKFARECILWGRKSGTMLVECTWKDM